MSKTGDREIGGASIKGRPSIHSHPFCPFAHAEAMGKFGLKTKREDRRVVTAQHGNRSNNQDEVDHTFSKPMNPISPPLGQRNKHRRKSLDEDEHREEDSSKLSKSSPATFPLHSYCSDDISEDEIPMIQEQQHDSSYQSSSGSPYNRSTNRTPANGSNIYASDFSTNNTRNLDKQETNETKLIWLLVLIGIAVTVASMFQQTNTTIKTVYDESKFYKDIDELGNRYRIDDNAVLQMQTGIATIFERQDTGSFMFVYNSNDDHFNAREFNTFINDVSNIASKYLRNESTPVHYTLVEADSLDMFGHSELINTFREDLDRTGVMLVKHVEAIPSSLAMAFHYYCDEYNPLVRKSAIFFTLNLAKCPLAMDKKSSHAAIEKCLAQKWSGVPTDSIGPLLTRVVSVVIDLTDTF